MRRPAGVAALGLALCLLAGAFGVVALYVPGATLVLLAGAAEATVRAARARVRLAREPRAATIEEGSSVRFALRMDGGWRALGTAEVSSWPGAEFVRMRRPVNSTINFAARLERRGRHVVGPSTVRFRDPFGMCERAALSPSSEVLVLPRVEPVATEQLAGIAAGVGEPWRSSVAAGSDVDLLAPYRPGAPASLIHWPTVARTGTLFERRIEAEVERLPLIVLDARASDTPETLDMAVRAAASLCVALARAGGCSLLAPGERRAQRVGADLLGWPALHARLALVAPGGAPVWSAIVRAASVVWVSAAPPPHASHGSFAADYTVSPFALATRPVLFAVAGCAVQPARSGARARAA